MATALEERLKIVIVNPGYLSIADVFFDVIDTIDTIDPKLLTLLENLTGHTSMGFRGCSIGSMIICKASPPPRCSNRTVFLTPYSKALVCTI